jgi:V-type H+-transporting ATPase subunit E
MKVQVERQIDQMVRFIKQEAEEKANEISVSAEEVCFRFNPPRPW